MTLREKAEAAWRRGLEVVVEGTDGAIYNGLIPGNDEHVISLRYRKRDTTNLTHCNLAYSEIADIRFVILLPPPLLDSKEDV